MFEVLTPPPDDPILSLGALVRADTRPEKLDLGIGVYVDERGNSPVMSAVRRAEQRVIENQSSKGYLPPRGNAAFLDRFGERIFGSDLWDARLGTISSMQTVGCLAALRIGGEVLRQLGVRRIWVSDPTWPIHGPIVAAAGLRPLHYRYHTVGHAEIDWTGLCDSLAAVQPGDAVLLHGCCHNPTGADPSLAQWAELASLLNEKQAIPIVDVAYAGLGRGWDDDLAGVRLLVDRVDEAIVAVSCSKSFSLYRERGGALFFAGRDPVAAATVLENGITAARTSYSMAPDHGAATVAEILGDPTLTDEWLSELGHMRARINDLRVLLADEARWAGLDWEFLRHQRGMFSLLPLGPDQVERLRLESAVYFLLNGRICIAGLSPVGIRHLVTSCAAL